MVFVTFYLLGTTIPDEPSTQLELWATFLGVSSATLAALQYAPQIVHTYRLKLVGALSIPMMLIQTPGAIFMVLSIALRYANAAVDSDISNGILQVYADLAPIGQVGYLMLSRASCKACSSSCA